MFGWLADQELAKWAPERSEILNIGGFSDVVFEVMSAFLTGDVGRFTAQVKSIEM